MKLILQAATGVITLVAYGLLLMVAIVSWRQRPEPIPLALLVTGCAALLVSTLGGIVTILWLDDRKQRNASDKQQDR